jgi:hypothetical protein
MAIKRDNGLGYLSDDAAAPTVGVSLSPWLIALVAVVYLTPKLFHTYRVTRTKKD